MVSASKIHEHMEIVGSDGKHLGTVDRLENGRIKITKSSPGSGGHHHYIDVAAVDSIDNGKVRLNMTEQEARELW